MISNGFFYLVIALLVTLPVLNISAQEQTAPAAEKSDIFFLCRRDKNLRWLRAYKLASGKCQTLYSKEGYLQVVSSATYFSMCEGVLQSVQKNLEEGGFKCTATENFSIIEIE